MANQGTLPHSPLNLLTLGSLPAMQFSTSKKVYGSLSDQDRIFTNLYKDGDPFIKGALKRVRLTKSN